MRFSLDNADEAGSRFFYVVSTTYIGDHHEVTKKIYAIEALANLVTETKITMRKPVSYTHLTLPTNREV